MRFKASYSIKDLEKLSGVKAHTLRIWEKRYALFKPHRTKTNIRFYSNDDLKRILNIGLLNKNGLKISRIADLTEAELSKKVTELSLVRTVHEDIIDQLIIGMIDLNENFFSKIFSDSILRIGFEATIEKIIFPFFYRIGVMWQTGGINPAQEHFISNIVRQKLIVAIDGINQPDDSKTKTIVLFLPENELHELSLLFYNYALRARNYRTIYLGQTVPAADLIRIATIIKPHAFIAVLTNPLTNKGIERFVQQLSGIPGNRRILLSGRTVVDSKYKLPSYCHSFRDLSELLKLV